MGLVIVAGVIIVLNQNKEDKSEKPVPDIRGPDVDMGSVPVIQYRTDLLKAYRGWKVAAGDLIREYDLNMRKIILWGTSHPDLNIDQMRAGYPDFETFFPAYSRQFSDLLQQGEQIMTECNTLQDHDDPAYMGHTEIQMEIAPLAERYRTLEGFWDMLNRRFKEQEKRLTYEKSYGNVSDKFKTAEMDLTDIDYGKKDDYDFFLKKPSDAEMFLDTKPTPSTAGNVKTDFQAKPVQSDRADDTRNFASPASTVSAIPVMDAHTFNTTNTPLPIKGKPKLTSGDDKAPAAPTQMVKARPGRPAGPGMDAFVQGDRDDPNRLPTHRIRADETETLYPEEGPMTEAMMRFMTPQEKGAAVKKLKKQEAVERGKMGLIDFNNQTYTLSQIEDFVNRLDRGSYEVPTNVEAAVSDYDSLSNAVNTLDAIITTDEMSGGRFSSEEARAVKMIASAGMARYEKMIHDNFNVSVKKRNEKDFPVEWLETTKKAKFGAPTPTPGSG